MKNFPPDLYFNEHGMDREENVQTYCKDKANSVQAKGRGGSLHHGYFLSWSPQQARPHPPGTAHIRKFLVASHCIGRRLQKSRHKICFYIDIGSDFHDDWSAGFCCLCQGERQSQLSGTEFIFFAKDYVGTKTKGTNVDSMFDLMVKPIPQVYFM